MANPPALQRLIVSAPFGNYIQPAGATATLGTFTRLRRPGRLWRILKTVRYYRRLGAWVNQIGLRNPGIDWLAERARAGKVALADKILSIHGFTADDWYALLERSVALAPQALELNISCPNVGEVSWPADLFTRAVATGCPIIVKVPPVRYEHLVADALGGGVRTFHCTNTLPVPVGGMSGKPLKPLALLCLSAVRSLAGATPVRLIGGGGITTPADIADYARAGAQHVAIGTVTMRPRLLWTHAPLAPLIRAADDLLRD